MNGGLRFECARSLLLCLTLEDYGNLISLENSAPAMSLLAYAMCPDRLRWNRGLI